MVALHIGGGVSAHAQTTTGSVGLPEINASWSADYDAGGAFTAVVAGALANAFGATAVGAAAEAKGPGTAVAGTGAGAGFGRAAGTALGAFAGQKWRGGDYVATGFGTACEVLCNSNIAAGDPAGQGVIARGNIAIGFDAAVTGIDNILTGDEAGGNVSGGYNIAVRQSAREIGASGALGDSSHVLDSDGNMASTANGTGSAILDGANVVNAGGAVAIGSSTTITDGNAVVIGTNSAATAASWVAVGSGTVAVDPVAGGHESAGVFAVEAGYTSQSGGERFIMSGAGAPEHDNYGMNAGLSVTRN